MTSSISRISVGSLKGYKISIGNSEAKIISDWGCNLISLRLGNKDVIDGNTKAKDLKENNLAKSCLLIPFPNRVNHGKYSLNKKKYQLKITEKQRGHAIHGLVTQKKFKLLKSSKSAKSASLTFKGTIRKKEFKGYPFDLDIEITFILGSKSLQIKITSKNVGKIKAPYGLGWHPYIKSVKKIDFCNVHIPAKNTFELESGDTLIPTGKLQKNPLQKNTKLKSRKFDTCFLNLTANKAKFDDLELFFDKSIKFIQVYTPKDRMSIAIEPMSCAPDAYNNKLGLILLKPLSSVSHNFGVRIRK